MDGDRHLLEQFLRGELDEEAIALLEARFDEEPDLIRQLADMAKEVEGELPDQGTTRITALAMGLGATVPTVATGLELREPIAEGGMGVVHRARQRSIGRTVAVKTVVSRKHDGPLIHEAMLTGYLEHPNIVPIHDITLDDDGKPLVVMKHIEGTPWRRFLSEPTDSARRPLEWHVRIVIQVCQALRFAHSRGIVHRDVKPDNVMIGEFDEVYLLDWGLAASLEEGSRLPSLAAQYGYAGTPAYMAPEQLADDAPDRVGVHTDVYLVGASLYHAAVGRPPQRGRHVTEIRDQVEQRGELSFPAQVPDEIAEILRRAMAFEPDDRYASTVELREALEAFLDHRASSALVLRGDEEAARMVERYEARDTTGAERAFFEATFSYRAALESWPGNALASERLHGLVKARVEQLLAVHAPEAARRVLALVDVADSDLHATVERAIAAQEKARDRLRNYERGDDRKLGLMTRRFLGLSLGAIWVGLNVIIVTLPVTSPWALLIGALICLALTVVVLLRTRQVMIDVRLNRYNASIALLAQVAQVVLLAVGAATGRTGEALLIELLMLWALAAAAVAVVVDRRILPTAIAYAAGYVACRLDPDALVVVLPAGAVVMVVVSIVINVLTARREGAAGAS